MKQKFLIGIFCALVTLVSNAQISTKKQSYLIPSHSSYLFFPKSLSLKPTQTLKKDLSMRYEPAKLPFFCAMEERSRHKFKFILKLRTGDDESYRKMITTTSK